MFTTYYNGMYINASCSKSECYVTDEFGTFYGRTFKSLQAAKVAITKARNTGIEASR